MIGASFGIRDSDLRADLTSRINGADGKIELIKSAIAALGAPEIMRKLLAEALGEAGFKQLKTYRDAIIHSRVLDSDLGIAVSAPKKGKFAEILLTAAALNGVYDRLELLRQELIALTEAIVPLLILFEITQHAQATGRMTDPELRAWISRRKQAVERGVRQMMFQVQERRSRRLSLPPLPEFPEESEAPLA